MTIENTGASGPIADPEPGSDAPEYSVLIYGEESYWEDVPPERLPQIYAPFEEIGRRLAEAGHVESGGVELQPAATAVFVRSGVVGVAGGAHTALPEQLGGIFIIRTHDVDDVARIFAEVFAGEPYLFEIRPSVSPEDTPM